MGGAAPPPEHLVRCLPPLTKSGGDEVLRLLVDDREIGVSHSSSTKTAAVQKRLRAELQQKLGPEACRHFPVKVHVKSGGTKEGTHRARSFLFATLGAIIANAFGERRVSFHENGVVSLNLPPVGSALGTRATRTTHPKSLNLFSRFLSFVFEDGMRVDNPFFWKTKADVLATIARLDMAEQIVATRSCADIHNQTKQYPHCGRCSQCIDRRFAVLAAGLEAHDPADAYRVDLVSGRRSEVRDREIALSYVRNAFAFEHLTPEDLLKRFPAIVDAFDGLEEPATSSLRRLSDLLRRHGAGVANVMRQVLSTPPVHGFPADSLPRTYGEVERSRHFAEVGGAPLSPVDSLRKPIVLEIDRTRQRVVVDGVVDIGKGATSDILILLADSFLEAAGRGLDPLEYPWLSAKSIAGHLGLASDEVARKRITRTRGELARKFASAGLDPDVGHDLIENVPWHGYRLTPELVTVRRRQDE